METPQDPIADPHPMDAPAPTEWHPLPERARVLFLLGGALWLAAAGGAAGIAAGLIASTDVEVLSRTTLIVVGATLLGAAGAALGLWLGHKQFCYTAWKLDDDGLAVRRGRLWQSETRVPVTRVQHLDLKHGPLQRHRDLATLIVHTAGTAHNTVGVPNLDAGDAERLRDTLARLGNLSVEPSGDRGIDHDTDHDDV